MNKWKKTFMQLAAVIIIIAVSIFIYTKLSAAKKAPEKKSDPTPAPLVQVIKVKPKNMQMDVTGYGTVKPCKIVQVVPQVSGKIISRNKNMVDGGFFKADTALVTIEKSDYEIAVQMAQAKVAQAMVALDREEAEAKIAKDQWQKLNPEHEPQNILVYHEPQIRSAKAQLKAARVQLEKAQLDLQRTKISMPFNGRVLSAKVDIGQFISTGQSIAEVYSTSALEIEVPLENQELQWLDLAMDGSGNGPQVKVYSTFAGKKRLWHGKVVRTRAQIDTKSRMVYIVVQVNDLFDTANSKIPLTPGMFVSVCIQGRTVKSVIPVPRHAVHNKNQVWTAKDGILKIIPVKIIRKDKNLVYISKGLNPGDYIITSPIEIISNGMKIRTSISRGDK